MKERPILFSAPMVRALLEGRKTQTRRIVRPTSKLADGVAVYWTDGDSKNVEVVNAFEGEAIDAPPIACPYGVPGDRLWVRETWWHYKSNELEQAGFVGGTMCHLGNGQANYQSNAEFDPREHPKIWRKRPSIYMPRWASRITLELTDVRVERLHDISEEDAHAEGVDPIEGFLLGNTPHRRAFYEIWESLNAKRAPWESNPWVWCLTFSPAGAAANKAGAALPRLHLPEGGTE